MTKPPKGWRLLELDEVIQQDDKMDNDTNWHPTNISKKDERTPRMQGFRYIRHIKRKNRKAGK